MGGEMTETQLPLAERLRSALEDGGIAKDGRLLPERELADRMGVGRRALREALALLEAEGIIWRRQGQGTFVSAQRPRQPVQLLRTGIHTTPAELLEVRMELEPILGRLCALRATREQVDRISQAAVHASQAETPEAFEISDIAFHRAVAEGANNSLFLAMFESVAAVLKNSGWRAVRQSTFSHSRRSQVSHQHQKVFEAIADRDPFAAEQAMRQHLASVYEHLQNRF